MPVNFIPNQPFIFELPIGAYPCLNNDPKQYSQLVQPDDKVCIQWQMEPCLPDVECEPEMYELIPDEFLKEWTATDQWFSSGYSSLTYMGNGSAPTIPQCALNLSLTLGAVYKLSFTAQVTGTASFTLNLGISSTPTITTSGNYTYYLICSSTSAVLEALVNPSATDPADTIILDSLSLQQVTTCWLDELNFNTASWTYDYNGAYGKFCALDTTGGDLINLGGYTSAGNYHSVSFVIDSCTQGGLEVVIGTVSIGTTSGNGSFTFYGTPTSGSGELRFIKQDNFDGCISQVDVNDFGIPATRFNVYFSKVGGGWTTSMLPTWYDDRVVLCTDWTTLDPDADECDLIQITLYEECQDEVIYNYPSINYARYNPNGWDCTKVVEAYSDGYAYGFYFGDINNPDFTLVQRLRVLQFNPIYPNEGEEYLYSNGAYTRSFGQTGKRRQCWFDYVDEACHDTIRVQLMSQKLFVDNYAFYFPIENYEPEWAENGKYNLAQSRVVLVHEETLFSSPCGALANPICPPQVNNVCNNLNDLILKVDGYDLTGAGSLTSVRFIAYLFDQNGIYSGTDAGSFRNLTTMLGQGQLLSDLLTILNNYFATSSSGTLTYSAPAISIDVTASGAITIPFTQTISINLVNNSGNLILSVPIKYL